MPKKNRAAAIRMRVSAWLIAYISTSIEKVKVKAEMQDVCLFAARGRLLPD
jgi:hypothetical protein